jgi:hypothetical protein
MSVNLKQAYWRNGYTNTDSYFLNTLQRLNLFFFIGSQCVTILEYALHISQLGRLMFGLIGAAYMYACQCFVYDIFLCESRICVIPFTTMCVGFQVRLPERDVEGISQMNLYGTFFTYMWY